MSAQSCAPDVLGSSLALLALAVVLGARGTLSGHTGRPAYSFAPFEGSFSCSELCTDEFALDVLLPSLSLSNARALHVTSLSLVPMAHNVRERGPCYCG